MNGPLRLTGVHAGALLAFAVAVLAMAKVIYDVALHRSLDAALESRADEISRYKITWDTERGRIGVVDLERSASNFPTLYVQAFDRDGTVVARSESLGAHLLPSDEARLARVLAGEAWLEELSMNGQWLRMYTAPLRIPSTEGVPEVAGIVEVARPLDPSAGRELAAIGVAIAAAAGLAAPLALAAGALMTRSALAPLDGFLGTVRAISDSGDLGLRVDPGPRTPYPEIARLADEFNRMLARLQAAAQRLDDVLDAQRRFVADASHELRTPLTSLVGNIRLLREEPMPRAPAEQLSILADMDAEAARMSRLVGDLLLLAEADAGRHLVLEPVDVASVVRRAIRAARALRTDVVLQVQVASASGWWVCGDPDRLIQVILILLDNALKFSPPGGTVTMRVDAAQRAGRSGVQIQVADNGPGVARGERELIFERFYRSDHARHRGGSGLGLPIARWIVHEHHGTLEVDSTVARGATFSVWLPTRADDAL
jgi:two-component system, OmpR family, sensor kinase